ncbi:MAG: hypothetical protein P9M15_03555 [Candidatus Electryoneaceae bacterium]|nr:hypothetical protein [Candidatus Electryoneaceae bacterium]
MPKGNDFQNKASKGFSRQSPNNPIERKQFSVDGADFRPQRGCPTSSEAGDIPRSRPTTYESRESKSEGIIKTGIRWEYIYGMLGLLLGLVAIIGGVILIINGCAGSVSWTVKFLALESNVNDATPGVVLLIIGLFLVKVTYPKVKLKNLKG